MISAKRHVVAVLTLGAAVAAGAAAWQAAALVSIGVAHRGGMAMAGAKLIVLYPAPTDVNAFEQAYTREHVQMVTPQNFSGLNRFVASKIVGSPDGSPAPFHRIAELHFSSLEALQAAAGSAPAQPVVAHAVSISSGGRPVLLVAEEESKTF